MGLSSAPGAITPRVLSLPWWPWWPIHVSPRICRPKPPSHCLPFQSYLGVGPAGGNGEGVGGRADADDRLARLDVFDDVPHLLVGQIAEPREDNHQVGRFEGLQAGNVVQVFGVDRAGGRIDGKQHGTLEPVPLGEDLAQLRQGFLGAILLVAGDQHDVLSLARPVVAVEDDPGILGGCRIVQFN